MDPISEPVLLGPLGYVATALALASACGLRTFLPLFVLSALGLFGLVPLASAGAWLASLPALVIFGVLMALELGADKLPGVDHTVDAVGFVLKPVAAMLVSIAAMRGSDPWVAGLLGAIAGGTAATVLGVAKGRLRLLSTAWTQGLGNVVLSIQEDGVALLVVILALLVPPLAFAALALAIVLLLGAEAVGRRTRWSQLSAQPTHL